MSNNPPFDLPRAHRWFAVECNNAAWDLVEASSRTPEQAERMVHLAHAACAHWLAAGGPLQHVRALALLCYAYGAAGEAQQALRWGQRCIELGQGAADQSPFDRAVNAGGLARAFRLAGRQAQADEWETTARNAAAALNGGTGPYQYALSTADLEVLNRPDKELWKEYCRQRNNTPTPCQSGRYRFHIDAYGRLQLCSGNRRQSYDLRSGSLQEGFFEQLPSFTCEYKLPGSLTLIHPAVRHA